MARGKVLTTDEKQLITQLCSDGLTYRAIALRLNPVRSHTVVRNYSMKRELYGMKKLGRKPFGAFGPRTTTTHRSRGAPLGRTAPKSTCSYSILSSLYLTLQKPIRTETHPNVLTA